MPDTAILSVRNLSVEFPTEQGICAAVNQLSFTLNKGETLGIVGESGSGKSITSLCIMGLLPSPPGKIAAGEIIYHGTTPVNLLKLDKSSIRTYRGRHIAMIFQEPMTSLNPVMTCGRQMSEAIRLHLAMGKKQAKERSLSLFQEVQLPDPERIFSSYPHQLSGGQKQRVMIAMALSGNPEILIADEPTTALDVSVQQAILDLLAGLKEKFGLSVIFITHDLGVIAHLADRVLVMHQGKLVETGRTARVFNTPSQPYTQGLMACRPDLHKRLKRLPTVADFLNDSGKAEAMAQRVVTTAERQASLERIYSQAPILQVRGLKVYYPSARGLFSGSKQNVKAVDDVSFDVYPGETLGLVGESGCGKTTLGRTLVRLLAQTEGTVTYKGRDLSAFTSSQLRAWRKEIQIIFQDPYSSLNPRLTAGAAIMEPMRVHNLLGSFRERKERAIEILSKTGLTEAHFYRYPHEFSGGQRQRVCIARALALNPSFIVCDESVSALDVSVQAQVLNLLNKLKEEFGFTYIFISHDLSVVKYLSDKIIVMEHGRIVEAGEADVLILHPQQAYTKRLIAAIPG